MASHVRCSARGWPCRWVREHSPDHEYRLCFRRLALPADGMATRSRFALHVRPWHPLLDGVRRTSRVASRFSYEGMAKRRTSRHLGVAKQPRQRARSANDDDTFPSIRTKAS